jgi:hypothetical protein
MINGLSFPNLKVLASVTLEDVQNTQVALTAITDNLTSYSGIVGITFTSNSNLRLLINIQGESGDAETDDPGFWIFANQEFTIFMSVEEMRRTMKIWVDASGTGVANAELNCLFLGQE